MNNFVLGSGFHRRSAYDEAFAIQWYQNIRRYAPFPFRITIISTGAPFPVQAEEINVILGANLGHIGDKGASSRQLCGWSASVMALCMIAYNCESDLVFLEQDAMAFGHWLEQAYADMGDADCVFGYGHATHPFMPCSQALFIIRHRFLLEFVRRYLSLVPDVNLLPEAKFVKLETQDPARFRRLSFPCDRERPIPYDASVFYVQQIKPDEMDELKRRGLC